MNFSWSRRDILRGLLGAAAIHVPWISRMKNDSKANASPIEVHVTSISSQTFRLSLLPLQGASVGAIPADGSLVRESWGEPIAKVRGSTEHSISAGNARLQISSYPLSIAIAYADGKLVQELRWDEDSSSLTFLTGTTPLFGLGEGGEQFDRRGSLDLMKSGQSGYKLATHGGRVPIPWIIGTQGWAMFFHQPYGTFDLRGPEAKFKPASTSAKLLLDLFFTMAQDPATIMAEYARLTGLPEMPPLWSLGYQQSHRTLASREEVLGVAKTFREKKLPCDTLIYLGTGFCPSGWNTENGSFVWNSRVFADPKAMLDELHSQHFKVVPHVVILSDRLHGSVQDACDLLCFDEAQASCYWDAHRRDFAMGIDGWWPDEGDPMDVASRLTRNRMYWEGPQLDRPNERPYALHRNGYAGMQRYASFLWSGDVYSTWETLKTHIPLAINTGLSGIPYWGTDIGGFVPTPEFTAELYVRWFQFGAFCPLFRCHGRAWKLRVPWGWNTGDPGPTEIEHYTGAAIPDSSQLHDARVEVICRKYLELRYRLLPYLYSMVHEGTKTGLPVMRALWLHFPNDASAVSCGDEYLWGRSFLVAPVVEKGAANRRVYLPQGEWHDFWSEEQTTGGREIIRNIDLETMPLYVRAGSIVPMGPVKQFTSEKSDAPLTLSIYPGADASFLLYEDDGTSFNYRNGEWMGIEMSWNESRQTLRLELASRSHMLPPSPRDIEVRLKGKTQMVKFTGKPIEMSF